MKKHISKPTWQAPNAQTKTDEKKRTANSQHPIGNFAPNALMDSVTTVPSSELPVQPKLTIGQVGDKYEQEADQMASQVVQQIHSPAGITQQTTAESVQCQPNDLVVQRNDFGFGLFDAYKQMSKSESIVNNKKEYFKCLSYLRRFTMVEMLSKPGVLELLKTPCKQETAEESWQFMNDFFGGFSAQELYDKYIEESEHSQGKTQFSQINFYSKLKGPLTQKGRDNVNKSDFSKVVEDIANRILDAYGRFSKKVKVDLALLLGYGEPDRNQQPDFNNVQSRDRRSARSGKSQPKTIEE